MLQTDKKILWNDIQSGTQQEIKKAYKLTDNQLEKAVRQHIDGASTTERREFYQNFYQRRK